ncbi:MAG: hypothetical protein HZB59_05635 [Ignavibacteriales bacterium]|nr:hypothetical protein [Ignavibacteriales bacterium]
MNRVVRFRIIVLLIFTGLNLSLSQFGRQRLDEPKTIPHEVIQGMFKDGINVMLEIDTACIKWEIDERQMESQVKLAIENSGWAFNPSSPNIMRVKIDSTSTTKENYLTLRIELTHSLDEFPTKRTIELQKGDNKLISSVVYQMVYKSGIKSRNQLLKEISKKHNPEHIQKSNAQ